MTDADREEDRREFPEDADWPVYRQVGSRYVSRT